MVFDRRYQTCPALSVSNKHQGPYEYEKESRLFHARYRPRRRLFIDFKFARKMPFILKILNFIADWTKSQLPGSYLFELKIFKTKFEICLSNR